jgi:methionine-rich copper-binding protein CopC
MTMNNYTLVLAAFAALTGGVSQASAHAFLDQAMPAVGSTVHGSPAEVKLRFSQALEPAFSTIRVLDQSGKQVDRQDKEVDPNNRALLRVSLPKLSPGLYRAVWRVLSVDSHVSEGDFTFNVAP